MKPLDDITVLEFSTMVTASLATMMMAEQGARAIKVEPIDGGDPMRFLGTSKAGISGLFANCNRGKESIRVDLKHPEGLAIVKKLVPKVDVLIHNYRPGVMDSLKLGSDAMRAMNPALVYVAISGFGKDGPFGNSPAYDPIIQAHAGFAASQGGEQPLFIRNLMCDKITAYTACQAVTAALYQRSRTGEGQHIDVAMIEAGLAFLFPDAFMNHTLLDEDRMQMPLLADLLYEMTLTRDGAITLSAGTFKQRYGVLVALGKEDLLADPRFDSDEKLFANRAEYVEELRRSFLDFTTDEILARLADNDVPAAKCRTLDEVIEHPQITHNNTIEELQHPLMGRLRVVRPAARFGGEQLPPGSHAPAHGQHTADVLSELGYSPTEIDALTASGAIAG